MKDSKRLTVQVKYYYNPYKGIPDPRKSDKFKKAISVLKDFSSCCSVMFYDEIFHLEELYKEDENDN